MKAVENADGSVDVTIHLRGVHMCHDGLGKFEMVTYNGSGGFLVPFRGRNMPTKLVLKLWAEYSHRRSTRERFSLALAQKPSAELVIA